MTRLRFKIALAVAGVCCSAVASGWCQRLASELESRPLPAETDIPPDSVPYEIAPEPIKLVRPEYPQWAREAGIGGEVILKILIDEDGRVVRARVEKSVHAELDTAAIRAARQCVFSPATVGDKPVTVWVSLPVRFALEERHLVEQDRPPAPPTDVRAFDTPNDAGGCITVEWSLSRDDGEGEQDVMGYDILRSTVSGAGYEKMGSAVPGDTVYVDLETEDGVAYFYIVEAKDVEHTSPSEEAGPAVSSGQWFNRRRSNMLAFAILLSAFILYFIRQAKRGQKLFIRKLAGLEAVDEGIGRATEMGKPVLYIPGITDMDDIQTIASMVILGRVAKRVAQYDTPLVVPSKMPVAYTMAQEVVKQAYTEAGRPDAYNPDNIPFLTMDQFGYAAAVDGIMLRDKPGTIFFLGAFYAESLILAETGHSVGAIQIAGTAMPAQLPFFITACDYTLIGEELFAASAYLSGEPLLLGSLKGQDWGKALFMLLVAAGVLLELIGVHWLTNWLQTF